MSAIFDSGRAMDAIHEICGVSEFIESAAAVPKTADGVEHYLWLAHRRLAVVVRRFADLGYETVIQGFDFRGQTAMNAVFSRGKHSDQTLLFVGHHDYCAGVGAEDDGTALAVMLELARCVSEEKSHVAFASFDLEEAGLVGSRHFVDTMSAGDLDRLSGVIALECLGSGRDVVICERVSGATSNPTLVSSLNQAATEIGREVLVEGFDWFNADHVSFAERGVRTAEVCSYNARNYKGGPSPDVNVAHSALDMPHSILPATLTAVGDVLLQFLAT
jgi:aminopeptidase S